jgi:hypothetical protein
MKLGPIKAELNEVFRSIYKYIYKIISNTLRFCMIYIEKNLCVPILLDRDCRYFYFVDFSHFLWTFIVKSAEYFILYMACKACKLFSEERRTFILKTILLICLHSFSCCRKCNSVLGKNKSSWNKTKLSGEIVNWFYMESTYKSNRW